MSLLKPVSAILVLSLIFLANSQDLIYPQHNEKLRSIISLDWDRYYQCQQTYYQKAGKEQGTDLMMVFPGHSIELSCTPCQRPFQGSEPFEWKVKTLKKWAHLVAFDEMPEEFEKTDQASLIMRNAKEEFSGIYQCFEGNNLVKTYIVEVPARVNIITQTFKEPENLPIGFTNLVSITVKWEAWTECSTCNTVGKKYRYGMCLVTTNGQELRQDRETIIEDFGLDLNLFKGNISCSSRFLSKKMTQRIAGSNISNIAVMQFCKTPCIEGKSSKKFDIKKVLKKNFKSNAGKMLRSLRDAASNIERTVITVNLGSALVIQCPGWTEVNIPITWKKGMKGLVDEVISANTQGRVNLDVFGRITINKTEQSDAGIYTCWEQKKLLGLVHLLTNDLAVKRSSDSLKILSLLVAFFILIKSFYLGWKAWKHRGYN